MPRKHIKESADKFFSLDKNIRIASVVAAVVILWMLTGLFSCSSEKVAKKEAEEKTVAVVHVKNDEYQRKLSLSGRSEPDTLVRIAAQTSGEIENIVKKQGQQVSASDLMLTIKMDTRDTQLKAAKAALKEAQAFYNSAKKLNKEGYRADTSLASQEAALESARNALAQIEKDIEHTKVRAPLTGFIESLEVEIGDYVSTGDQLFELIGTDKYIISAYVSQKEQAMVHPNQIAHVRLVNGQDVSGTVTFVSRKADDATKTYRVEITIDGAQHQIPTGMTAKIDIPTDVINAEKIPHAALVLNDEGTLGVMTVDDEDTAHFQEVEMLEDASTHIWVTGIQTPTRLIVLGQGGVIEGEKIKAYDATDKVNEQN